MEKRTFLAIILSIFVLFGYQAFVMPKNKKAVDGKPVIMQTIVNKDVIAQKIEKIETAKDVSSFEKTKIPMKEETIVLENDKISITISNIGASIKKIDIKSKETIIVRDLLGVEQFSNIPFSVRRISENKIDFTYIKDGFSISKIYELSNQEYVLNIEILSKTSQGMSKIDKITAFKIDPKLSNKINPQEYGLYEYSIASSASIFRKNNAYKFSSKEARSGSDPIRWIGFRDKYYCVVLKPDFSTAGYDINFINENDLELSVKTSGDPESISLKSSYYIGPQDMPVLKSLGLGDFVVFSGFWLIDMVSRGVINFVDFANKYVKNPGFCIILVSFLIYLAMYPLTMSGMLSMKKMQSLQPKIAKLKEQHKNNPQKLNQEVMELYKENSINPLGGCLPFILQMPIFIGLYQALWRSVIFEGKSFLWIQDLSQPDRLFILPFNLPFLGNEFNILPLLMMVAMFAQQKLSSKNMVLTDESQVMQQKIMMIFFPIFLGVIFYKFASGLNLYFTVFYILSAVMQYKMSKMSV